MPDHRWKFGSTIAQLGQNLAAVCRDPIRRIALFLLLLPCCLTWAPMGRSALAKDEVGFANFRELLDIYGVDESHLRRFQDDRELNEAENEPLVRILHTIGRISEFELFQAAGQSRGIAEVLASPMDFRGTLVPIQGHVTKITPIQPREEVRERFRMNVYYQCEITWDKQAPPAIVYVLRIPKSWPTQGNIHERVSAQLVFLKRKSLEPPQGLFVTTRLAWHPDTVLGDLGMDVSLFDEFSVSDSDKLLRKKKPQRDKAEQYSEDRAARECFFQLLFAMQDVGVNELSRRAKGLQPVLPLLENPQDFQGQVVAMEGLARRAVLVRVSDPAIVKRFGIDHYYEVELFADDAPNLPATFCMLELPEGMPTGDLIRQKVRLVGFFYNNWRFRLAGKIDRDVEELPSGTDSRQAAPLLLGKSPILLEEPRIDHGKFTGTIAVSLVAVLVVVMWGVAWKFDRSSKQFYKQTLAQQLGTTGGPSQFSWPGPRAEETGVSEPPEEPHHEPEV